MSGCLEHHRKTTQHHGDILSARLTNEKETSTTKNDMWTCFLQLSTKISFVHKNHHWKMCLGLRTAFQKVIFLSSKHQQISLCSSFAEWKNSQRMFRRRGWPPWKNLPPVAWPTSWSQSNRSWRTTILLWIEVDDIFLGIGNMLKGEIVQVNSY